jgi:hypothetical protein
LALRRAVQLTAALGALALLLAVAALVVAVVN